jgi:hypothetical protein
MKYIHGVLRITEYLLGKEVNPVESAEFFLHLLSPLPVINSIIRGALD